MNAVLTSTPPGTQAAILRRVLGERHPKFALGDIAYSFDLTLGELQTIITRYGYPDTTRMRAAVEQLELEVRETAAAQVQPDAIADAGDIGVTLTNVRVVDLHTDPDNPREHLDGIEELADTIKSVGLLQPPVVRRHGGHLVIVAGHRRIAALRLLKWTHVDVLIRGEMRPDHVLAAMLIENGQRQDLDPIEEARGYRQLAQMGLTHTEIAARVGRSAATVATRLALLDLPPDEQEDIRAGALTLSHVQNRAALERQQARLRAGGRAAGRPTGAKTKPYFGDTHPLARAARCDHRGKPKIGGVGCGECWEQAIRADERRLNLEDLAVGNQA